MKIIKKVDITNWKLEHTCDKCETEMEVEKSDIRYQLSKADRPSDNDQDTFYFLCPVCIDTIYIDPDKLPKVLQVLLKRDNNVSFGGYFER
jgi:hypothetical protein